MNQNTAYEEKKEEITKENMLEQEENKTKNEDLEIKNKHGNTLKSNIKKFYFFISFGGF